MDMEALSIICAGLGIAEEEETGKRIGYSKGENCLENLKDLLRFLRRDDAQTREVFKQICKWKIVSKDLIPIIQYCRDDSNLVLNAVKVLVFLTMPIEPSSSDIPQQIEYLWDLKSAITYSQTVGIIVTLLEGPLENLERELFTEDDWKLVQLVLTLFRNMLAIQDISLPQKVGGSACHLLSLRDKFLELLFHENVMDLIVIINQEVCGSRGYLRQDNLLLLEIFHYIFMGQEPEMIAKAHLKDSKVGGDTKASLDSLKSIMEAEEKRKLSGLRNVARHSQFSGTFTRLTIDGSKAVYKGNPSSATENILLKPHKIQRSSTKKIVWDHGIIPSMKADILVLLHDFLNQFLSGGYNVLMQTICEDIEKEHHAIQKSDIVIFFHVAQFVTSFQYNKFLTYKPSGEKDNAHSFANEYADSTLFNGDMCGPIAATMNESMFLLVTSRWRNAFDGLKETNDFKFLSAAGSLMKIMIRMLDLVLKLLPEDSREPQTARILLYKLFYDQTDQGMTQFLLSLIKSFDTHKQSKSDLADLVEMIHVMVRLMENLQRRGTLRVSKRSRKVRKKKAPIDKKETENGLSGDEATVQDHVVSSNAEELNDQSILQEKIQKKTTLDNQENVNNAILVDKPETSVPEMENLAGNLPQIDKQILDEDDLNCSSDDSSGDEQPTSTFEVDFKVSTLISAFANHNIIRNLCWLLRFYKSNSISMNHHIICMLQRITDDLDLSPMLYQLSLLTTFYDILDEQKSCPCKEYANIVDFLTSLVRRMLRKMKHQPLLFVEILFWKSRRECQYINAEYLLHELGHIKKETRKWGNVSDEGGNGSTQANGWTRSSLADALGEDEADVVISHEPHQNGGNTVENETERVSKRKRRLVLTDELEMRIKDLYDKYKDDSNCSRLIAESLDSTGHISPVQVFNKLKQLGLKVVPKKRMRHADRTFSSTSSQPEEKGRMAEKENDLNSSVDVDRTLLKQSLTTRKRVSAFSKDQEEMIRALFEQFKEHKRCSYMIANALAADNSFTAAQVSRKLKQLGLRVPRQKKSEAKLHLRDEEINEFSIGERQDSDDETLLSLRKRKRNKDNCRSLSELSNTGERSGNSDDELLSSVLRHKSKGDDRLFKEAQNNEGDLSDNEILDSVLSKMRKRHPKAESKMIATSNTENSSDGVPEDIAERDVERIYEDVALDIRQEDASEPEGIGSISKNTSDKHYLAHQEMEEDALADFGDDDAELAAESATRTTPLRRKLRMVIDDVDDD
ncbi:protein timeless homolog isoform X2 [Jatropha curcas]|uniref:protein timeless homolog isoform X2 n=1 Tax=Jatropha curcas TaxID=180498 RepID=UPI0005FABB1F|nr:protein timeless homolog isoform X2 [Jatropha curcas]